MLDKPLVAFDIETIPDFDVARRVHGLSGSDADVVREFVHKRRAETDGGTDYPQSPFHRVACLCVTVVYPSDGRVEIERLGDSEPTAIEAFYRLVHDLRPRLVSWNGGGFDLPILRYRAMVHGIAARAFYDLEGDPRVHGYLARHGTMHVDVMDELSGHGASSHAGLATIARLLDLPNKSFVDKPIWEHWALGELDRVVEYCKLDTVLTALIYLAWSFHTGHAAREQVFGLVSRVREAIGREPFEGWRTIADHLEGWPRWPRS